MPQHILCLLGQCSMAKKNEPFIPMASRCTDESQITFVAECSGMKSFDSRESHQSWPAPSGCIMGDADQTWQNPEEVSEHQIPSGRSQGPINAPTCGAADVAGMARPPLSLGCDTWLACTGATVMMAGAFCATLLSPEEDSCSLAALASSCALKTPFVRTQACPDNPCFHPQTAHCTI